YPQSSRHPPSGTCADHRYADCLAPTDYHRPLGDLPGAGWTLWQPQRFAYGTPVRLAPYFQAAGRCGSVLPLDWSLGWARAPAQVWPQGGLRPPPNAIPQREDRGGAHRDTPVPDAVAPQRDVLSAREEDFLPFVNPNVSHF